MPDNVFDSASDRIHFSEAVDFLQQGRVQLIAPHWIDTYVEKGLWARQGDELVLTEEGERQHRMALKERFTDG